jgi:hypothetical protein
MCLRIKCELEVTLDVNVNVESYCVRVFGSAVTLIDYDLIGFD